LSHTKGLMRPLGVELVNEIIEAGLMLEEVVSGWFGSFKLQRRMHAFKRCALMGIEIALVGSPGDVTDVTAG